MKTVNTWIEVKKPKWRKSLSYQRNNAQWSTSNGCFRKTLTQFYIWECCHMVWKNLFDQLGSAVQAECPPNFLCTPSPLAGGQREKQRAPGCCVNTAQQWLKHWYLINTVLVTSLKHSTMQAARKKINSVSARPSTASQWLSWLYSNSLVSVCSSLQEILRIYSDYQIWMPENHFCKWPSLRTTHLQIAFPNFFSYFTAFPLYSKISNNTPSFLPKLNTIYVSEHKRNILNQYIKN